MDLPDGHIGLTNFRIASLCAYSAVVGSRQDLRCVFLDITLELVVRVNTDYASLMWYVC